MTKSQQRRTTVQKEAKDFGTSDNPLTKEELKAEVKTAGIDEVKTSQTSFDVLTSSGGYVRTYTVEAHKEKAEALAKQYASKIGGTVK